jgi:hypothetical protein
LFGEKNGTAERWQEGLDHLRARFAELAASPWNAAAEVVHVEGGKEHRLAPGELGCRRPLIIRERTRVKLEGPAGERTLVIGTMVQIGSVWRLVEL